MTTRSLLFAALLALAGTGASCDSGSAQPAVCDRDGCVVPLAEVMGACGPDLHTTTTDCPGVTVKTGACGDITHVQIVTVNPIQDCYFTTSSGQLVGAVVRSDSGFTKMAGTVPTAECPATTQVCDHTPP